MLSQEEILEIKKKVEDKLQERSKLEGQMEQLTKQLEDLGFNSLAEAKQALVELEEEKNSLQKELEKLSTEIEAMLREADE